MNEENNDSFIVSLIKVIGSLILLIVSIGFLLNIYLGSDIIINSRWSLDPLGMEVMLLNNNSIPVHVKGTICYIDPYGVEYSKEDVSVTINANSKKEFFSQMPQQIPLSAKFESTYVLPTLP